MTSLFENEYYKYKDNYYKVLRLVKVKCPINRNWYIGVEYQKAKEVGDYSSMELVIESPVYVRKYDEFIKRFEGA